MGKKKITSEPPKKLQVIQEITRNIESGKLKNGERLATVRKLSEHFNVSISVVQNAMKELMDEGFVECRGASGFYVRSASDEQNIQPEKFLPPKEDKIFLSAIHHSDLVWRYPYKTYNQIREEQLLHLLDLAERYPQFHFGVEQAEIMRIFIKDHPEKYQQLKQLFNEGRFELCGGLCIQDLNMISGESIVRAMTAGRKICNDLFQFEPEMCCMNDAFGMCAQLPQILAKCGFKYLLPGRRPNIPAELAKPGRPFYWYAMDDSKILLAHGIVDVTHQGYECNVPVIHEHDSQLAYSIANLKQKEGNLLVHYMTEEGEIKEDLFWVMEAINRNPGRKIEFGSHMDYFRHIESDEFQSFRGEFNPTFSGCYTTRISVKQKNRKAENLLAAAEMMDVFTNKKHDWSSVWHDLITTQFHDGICGCHHDLPNADISEKLDRVISETEKSFSYNKKNKKLSFASFGTGTGSQLLCTDEIPEGATAQEDNGKYYYLLDLPNCGVKTFKAAKKPVSKPKKASAKFKTDFYEADFSTPFPVIKNLNGENVFSSDHFGEILFRVDYGTMWAEKYMSYYFGHEQQTEKVISVTEGEVFFKVITEGHVLDAQPRHGNTGNHWPGFGALSFRKEYIFPKHHDTFRLKVHLDWTGNNTMISIKFPVDLKTKDMVETYEVPFGSIVRKPYFEVKEEYESTLKTLASQNDYVSAKGNWPALNWVNYSDLQKGLTVANTGTPGHQLINNEILVTLLRGGTNLKDGCMMPQTGSFENGAHDYEFAFCAHHPGKMEKALLLGRQMNCPPQVCDPLPQDGEFLSWNKENIVLSALAHEEEGIMFRLYEALGRQCEVTLSGKLLENAQLIETDMIGQNQSVCSESAITFRPFEIKTFIIK